MQEANGTLEHAAFQWKNYALRSGGFGGSSSLGLLDYTYCHRPTQAESPALLRNLTMDDVIFIETKTRTCMD